MNRIEYSTQTQVEVNRAEIASAVDAYLAQGGQITVLDGFQVVERPKARFDYKINSEKRDTEKKARIRYARPTTPRTPPEKRAAIAAELRRMANEGASKWYAIDQVDCGKELAVFIIEEHHIVFRQKKTIKDVADAFCGVTV